MKPKAIATLLLLAGATGALRAADPEVKPLSAWEAGNFSLLPRSFQRDPHLMVLIHTEFTKLGREVSKASAEHPVYYAGKDGGETEIGDVIGGERPPNAKEFSKVLVKILSQNGYLPAGKGHPPTIFIHYRWGSFNQLSSIDGGNADGSPEPDDDLQTNNLVERASLVGGEKFALDYVRAANAGTVSFFEANPRNSFLMQEARSNRYFVIATAYDYQAATQGNKAVLWRTAISTDSNGVTMDESLPGLVVVAGPYFGHETQGAVRLNRPVIREGKVTIGDFLVKQDLPPDVPAAPPAPAPAAAEPPAKP